VRGPAFLLTGSRTAYLVHRSAILTLALHSAGHERTPKTGAEHSQFINFSRHGGYEEEKWGYEDLIANRNQEAVQWLRDAVRCQPMVPSYWFNLGIAYDRLNNQSAAFSAYQRAYELRPSDHKYAEAAGKRVGTN
jgi:Flp pilus assembly protein TadD